MIMGLEVGMLVYGLYTLFTGKFQISKQRIVESSSACLAGFFFILPLPVAFSLFLSMGAQIQQMGVAPFAIEIGIIVICLILAFGIAYNAPYTTPDAKEKNS